MKRSCWQLLFWFEFSRLLFWKNSPKNLKPKQSYSRNNRSAQACHPSRSRFFTPCGRSEWHVCNIVFEALPEETTSKAPCQFVTCHSEGRSPKNLQLKQSHSRYNHSAQACHPSRSRFFAPPGRPEGHLLPWFKPTTAIRPVEPLFPHATGQSLHFFETAPFILKFWIKLPVDFASEVM